MENQKIVQKNKILIMIAVVVLVLLAGSYFLLLNKSQESRSSQEQLKEMETNKDKIIPYVYNNTYEKKITSFLASLPNDNLTETEKELKKTANSKAEGVFKTITYYYLTQEYLIQLIKIKSNNFQEKNNETKMLCRSFLYGSIQQSPSFTDGVENLELEKALKINNVSYVVDYYYQELQKNKDLQNLDVNKVFLYCYNLIVK